jgi:hypothetical protein
MGQLGAGGPTERCTRSIYALGPCARAPIAVIGGHRFSRLVTGDDHACALDMEGAIWCWGANSGGQLGAAQVSGTCTFESSQKDESLAVPCSRTPVRVPLERPAISVAAGEQLTCAADNGGTVWCWPMSRAGTPEALPLDRPVAAVTGGGNYFCGRTVDNGVRCWTATDGPVELPERTDLSSVTAGAGHACALDIEGRAWCWGSDADGALGIGHNEHRKYDVVPPTEVAGDHRFRFLATGATRTCGIDAQDALWCWGRVPEVKGDDVCLDSNYIGSTNDCVTHPVHVHATERFRGIAIGGRHQCALTMKDVTVCWGRGEAGQLGDGTLRAPDVTVNTPVVVRTGGMTRNEVRLLDLRDRLGWLMAHGGLVLLVLAALAVILGPWLARRGVSVSRITARIGDWWRAGAESPRSASGSRIPEPAGLVTVLVGWLMVGGTIASSISNPSHDEVGGGLAALGFLIVSGIALVLALVGGVLSLATLRRNGRAKLARLGVCLSALTLATGLVLALMLFWPRER